MSFLDDWKEWSTAKKAISIIAVCCVGLIIIGALMGGMSQDKNTAPAQNNNNAADNSANQPKGVQVKITYDGEWQGALLEGSASNTISGSGEKTIDIKEDAHYVSVNAQKMDGGSGTLSVQIIKDGKVLEETSTDAQYGLAQVSSSV
jgi:hypothetical protein